MHSASGQFSQRTAERENTWRTFHRITSKTKTLTSAFRRTTFFQISIKWDHQRLDWFPVSFTFTMLPPGWILPRQNDSSIHGTRKTRLTVRKWHSSPRSWSPKFQWNNWKLCHAGENEPHWWRRWRKATETVGLAVVWKSSVCPNHQEFLT